MPAIVESCLDQMELAVPLLPAYVETDLTSAEAPPLYRPQDQMQAMKVNLSAHSASPVNVRALVEVSDGAAPWDQLLLAPPLGLQHPIAVAGAALVPEKAGADMERLSDWSGMFRTPSLSDASGIMCRTPSDGGSDLAADASLERCTTMAILNIPYTYPKRLLRADIEARGLRYDYFHFPKDARKGRNRGFAFVNFTTVEDAQAFHRAFHDLPVSYPGDKEKRITVTPSSMQGFDSNAKLHPFAASRPAVAQTARARHFAAAARPATQRDMVASCPAWPRQRQRHSQRQGASADIAPFGDSAARILMRFVV